MRRPPYQYSRYPLFSKCGIAVAATILLFSYLHFLSHLIIRKLCGMCLQFIKLHLNFLLSVRKGQLFWWASPQTPFRPLFILSPCLFRRTNTFLLPTGLNRLLMSDWNDIKYCKLVVDTQIPIWRKAWAKRLRIRWHGYIELKVELVDIFKHSARSSKLPIPMLKDDIGD